MTNEIHDELVTPGCPQCARKHLESALTYLISDGVVSEMPPSIEQDLETAPSVLLARALINLGECFIGYSSHIRLVRGLLEQYEMRTSLDAKWTEAQWARTLRCCLTEATLGQVVSFDVRDLLHSKARPYISPLVYAYAHYKEALRELPTLERPIDSHFSHELILTLLDNVETTFFSHPVPEMPRQDIHEPRIMKGDDHGYESKKVGPLR